MGGIIGAVVGVGAILLLVAFFLLYRRRQKRKRDAARKEEPQFVDLDGDDDEAGALGILPASRRRRQNQGVSQSYNVSPFTYEQAAQHSPEPHEGGPSSYYDMPATGFAPYSLSRPGSIAASASEGRQQGAVSPGSTYPPGPASFHPHAGVPSMGPGSTSYLGSNGIGSDPSDAGMEIMPANSASTHPSGPGSVSNQGAYRLRTRNEAGAASTSAEAGPLPQKGQLAEDLAHDDAHRRYMMHADAGPVPQPGAHGHGDVEELPPNYGEWSGQASSAAAPQGEPRQQ